MHGGALLLALVLCQATQAADDNPSDDGPSEAAGADCGMSALYTLSRLCGRPLEWDAIRSGLPAGRSGHFSMRELSDAAARSGLRLQGVLLDRKDAQAIDRPMLIFLNRGQHGHFLVARPIGHTGQLVQLLDSVEPPEVLDRSLLLAAPSWTGLALMPVDPGWGVLAVRTCAGAVLVGALGWSVTRRLRGRAARRAKRDVLDCTT